MARKVFRNINDLQKYTRQTAAKILQTTVTEKAKDVLMDCIDRAYNEYKSRADRPYERRYSNHGLGDRDLLKQYKYNSGLTVRIRQEAQSDYNGKYLVDVYVTRGDLYNWKSEIYNKQPFPRDFYEYAEQEFAKKLPDIVQKEFRKYGIKSEKINISVRG